jgi:hypothetical protein
MDLRRFYLETQNIQTKKIEEQRTNMNIRAFYQKTQSFGRKIDCICQRTLNVREDQELENMPHAVMK